MKKTIAATAATTMRPIDIMNQMSRATTRPLKIVRGGRAGIPRRESGPTGHREGRKRGAPTTGFLPSGPNQRLNRPHLSGGRISFWLPIRDLLGSARPIAPYDRVDRRCGRRSFHVAPIGSGHLLVPALGGSCRRGLRPVTISCWEDESLDPHAYVRP
jgi:hypothetical protein